MTPIIKAEGLGKRYRIGKSVPYRTLREGLIIAAGAPMRLVRRAMRYRGSRAKDELNQIWALRNVSFEVMPGEVLGVIGRNGAGKSTLLKILSRITDPTEGRAELRGRVGSLLEVGTGFHPELTGRENTYLSGTILGMRRAEIARKFDAIVEFSGIEKFVDTPVKHYSSGMYVRLAFAVAAHLETEILLVDEVLAVGDSAFQKKCLGKMGEVARDGRTVILVSHNMASIESLCDTCLLLDGGRVRRKGHSVEVIHDYLAGQIGAQSGTRSLLNHPGRRYPESIMKSITLCSDGDTPVTIVPMGTPLSMAVEFEKKSGPFCPVLGIVVKTSQGLTVFGINNRIVGGYRFEQAVDRGAITCKIDALPLNPGTYMVDLFLGDHHQDYDAVLEAISFEVVEADIFGTGKVPQVGVVYLPASWTVSIPASNKSLSDSPRVIESARSQ